MSTAFRATLVAIFAAFLASPAGQAGARPAHPVNVARLRAFALEQVRDARTRGGQTPLAAAQGAGSPAVFQTVVNAQQVAQDTLHGAAGSENDTEIEPDVAVDPNNPDIVTAVAQQGRFPDGGSVDPGFATSQDGGTHWTNGNLPGLTVAVGGPFDRASDPAVAFGPDGSVYATTIPFDANDCRSAVSVQRSDDGGLHWNAPVFPQDDNDCNLFSDKNWMTVDTFAGSPHVGRLYLVWSLFTFDPQTGVTTAPAVLRYSDDRGAHWSGLIDISAPNVLSEGVLPMVEPNGDIVVVYDLTTPDFSKDFEVSQTSTDGGDHWGPPVTIGRFRGVGQAGMRTGGLPTATVDPVTGNLFTVWQDTRFRSDGLNDIVISRSKDEGASWSRLHRVNVDPTDDRLNHFTPDVAANGGVVHVTYDTRDDSGAKPSKYVRERYIVSTDNGRTFGGELIVGPPINLRHAAVADGHRAFLGDYQGTAATADAVHLAWTVAKRNGNERYHQTLWSATVVR